MIFGFNTDVKLGEVVYHVQSEARHKELLLQTQVFVKGQCIGKCAAPYAEIHSHPEFADEEIQEQLKAQHRRVVDAVRGGTLQQVLPLASEGIPANVALSASPAAAGVPQPSLADLTESLRAAVEDPAPQAHADTALPAMDASPEGLATGPFSIECLRASSEAGDAIALVLQVKLKEQPVEGAELALRLVWGQSHSRYCYATTDSSGMAEISLAAETAAAPEGRLLVQASREEVSSTRRFRLQPAR